MAFGGPSRYDGRELIESEKEGGTAAAVVICKLLSGGGGVFTNHSDFQIVDADRRKGGGGKLGGVIGGRMAMCK
jgi:hypothetical protein